MVNSKQIQKNAVCWVVNKSHPTENHPTVLNPTLPPSNNDASTQMKDYEGPSKTAQNEA